MNKENLHPMSPFDFTSDLDSFEPDVEVFFVETPPTMEGGSVSLLLLLPFSGDRHTDIISNGHLSSRPRNQTTLVGKPLRRLLWDSDTRLEPSLLWSALMVYLGTAAPGMGLGLSLASCRSPFPFPSLLSLCICLHLRTRTWTPLHESWTVDDLKLSLSGFVLGFVSLSLSLWIGRV